MRDNNPNNLEATFVKLSENIHYFITEFIDVLPQFAEGGCFLTVTVERSKKIVINEIWKLISIK